MGTDDLETQLKEMIRKQHEPVFELSAQQAFALGKEPWSEEEKVHFVESKAREILPFLLRVREESGSHGALTDAECHRATLLASRSTIEQLAHTLRRAVQGNPANDIKSRLLKNVEADLEDLKLLESPDVTEADLEEAANRIVGRMKNLNPLEK
jgi:hypothetical protein